ncbi:DUF3253 domain-containing protein [Marivita geojedonensis]|uniref:S-adenosylmethionine tRNA ribosyltransferase n=1 Tax=Marivita geojedonensis TaxID=1123756 RepID=A0A1X4NPP7_9RHOB|nr:DUF3253 domain-containing protein [Marivita geojedonensis]OSQ52634.1 hypothetical protein MGEO_04535 [Marivita geojedonensis]PRY80841.1 uncharacterized protein DUF3253 [Marivita geojedonensis]
MTPSDNEIADILLDLAHQRGVGKTFCPSEAARRLSDDWRPLMPEVRRVASQLDLQATQKGAPVDPVTAKGPIRLGLPG